MTVCRECCSVEQGYEEIENDDGTTSEVCACCGSDEVGEVDEDYGGGDR